MPNGWKEFRLGDITTQSKGLTYKSEDYGSRKNGFPFLTLKNVARGGGYSPKGLKFYRGEFKPMHKVDIGDVLFANTDLTRNGDVVGSPLYFDGLGFKIITLFSMDLSKLLVDAAKINSRFLYYLMMTYKLRKFMINLSAGSTALRLDTKSVRNLRILLPPPPRTKKRLLPFFLPLMRWLRTFRAKSRNSRI